MKILVFLNASRFPEQHHFYWKVLSDKSSVEMKMIMEIGGNILQGKTEVLGDKPAQCHSVYQKSHMSWPGINLGSQQ